MRVNTAEVYVLKSLGALLHSYFSKVISFIIVSPPLPLNRSLLYRFQSCAL